MHNISEMPLEVKQLITKTKQLLSAFKDIQSSAKQSWTTEDGFKNWCTEAYDTLRIQTGQVIVTAENIYK